MTSDSRYDLVDITPINARVDRIQRSMRQPFVKTPNTNAIHIAGFVTEYARDLLFSTIEQLPSGSLLYCDTDSVIYVRKRDYDPIPAGSMLGEMTDERPGRRIVEFVGGGPKNYGYLHVDGNTGGDEKALMKVRGFTLNYTAANILNFYSVRDRIIARFIDPTTGYILH